jgi:hypothetical protein
VSGDAACSSPRGPDSGPGLVHQRRSLLPQSAIGVSRGRQEGGVGETWNPGALGGWTRGVPGFPHGCDLDLDLDFDLDFDLDLCGGVESEGFPTSPPCSLRG